VTGARHRRRSRACDRLSRITWLSDVSPADWIAPRLHGFNVDTGLVIPEGFDAYCRIFHPLIRHEPGATSRTWAEVAAKKGGSSTLRCSST
jgi:hypothetical protein